MKIKMWEVVVSSTAEQRRVKVRYHNKRGALTYIRNYLYYEYGLADVKGQKGRPWKRYDSLHFNGPFANSWFYVGPDCWVKLRQVEVNP